MKAKIIIGGLIALANAGNSQNVVPNPGPGNVGIGTSSPLKLLDVRGNSTFGGGATESTYIWAPNGNERSLILTGNVAGGTDSYGTLILGSNDSEASNQALGGIGFGQNVAGTGKIGNAGLKVAIRGFSSGSGGSTSGYGGNLVFCTNSDNTSSILPERMKIDMNGYVGIGTSPVNGQLEVAANGISTGGYFAASANSSGTYWGAVGTAVSTNGASGAQVGVYGEAKNSGEACTGESTGVLGYADGSVTNFGGLFLSNGNEMALRGLCCPTSYGVYAYTANEHGEKSCDTQIDWAGYFSGNLGYTGSLVHASDRKLKKDIKPMTNMLEKIMQLKPSTYAFKKDDNLKDMNLPASNQMGLIAQELEEVFPELVTKVGAVHVKANEKKTISTPDYKGVQYMPLISVIISGMQEQQKLIEEQKQRIEALELAMTKNNVNNDAATSINNLQGAINGSEMSQNEPNPFTHETVIKYTLSGQTKVAVLNVYDLSGKQITSFPLEQSNTSITITSEKLAAGIYIYSIIADGKIVDSKRMMVAQK